jgi:predicted acyltransferase
MGGISDFTNLIFPLFVFIVGVSLVFSLGRTIEERAWRGVAAGVFGRSILLSLWRFLFGGFSRNWPDIRLLGVLNRIALCYFFCGHFVLAICPAAPLWPPARACSWDIGRC